MTQRQSDQTNFENYTLRVLGDGSEHIAYIRANVDRIPDFLQDSLAHVIAMAQSYVSSHDLA